MIVSIALLVGMAGTGIALCPVTTKRGVNFQVSSSEMPLYTKALGFVHRHSQYKLLAEDITYGLESDQDRVLAVFDWTRQNIKQTPEGWPVVDDHILNIIIRGHGLSDQMADVFCTLSTYADVPAFWSSVREPQSGEELLLSFARIGVHWVPFDVANGFTFTNTRGRLASLEELVHDPRMIAEAVGDAQPAGVSYISYLLATRPESFRAPDPLRAELQDPWVRLWYETKRAVVLESQD
jgi:hypothetical protein